ncbi:putative pyrroloquinoline-quinone binding quinoprotein [Bradyrhizobium sacchari]|uniref:Putative pyrroloquinoline-quinone binding quinoprotein n=1 Tax=Bradyrhizobium sacchari TaxID=1399419 RepID=A0A560KC70_9BRAD|nr:putative pyrroloquinoline-quinone binding quinoprotein [Bradyrhizobium sacchari]TWB80872.1 putative pyrroloquinoline-quinone binding quinoprotein [Bradyrhizobium sacchari]
MATYKQMTVIGVAIVVALTASLLAAVSLKLPASHATCAVTPEWRCEPGQWTTGGRDWRQSYNSPLNQINKDNVAKLGYAWSSDIDGASKLEATPIVVDDVMYLSSIAGIVYALNAATGEQLWRFDPGVASFAALYSKACCGPVNRGVAFWKGRVYVAAFDGTLYALDSKTGGLIWKADTIIDRSRAYKSTGAPYIARDLVSNCANTVRGSRVAALRPVCARGLRKATTASIQQ